MATDGRTEVSEETVFIQGYAEGIAEEVERLLAILPVIEDAQWEKSPGVERAAETQDRKATTGPADPVGDAVVDPARLAMREQAQRSEQIVRDVYTRLMGVRRGFEISLDRWEGYSVSGVSAD